MQLCKAGAAGYVLKRSAGGDLIQAIRDVAQGVNHFDPTLAIKALVACPVDRPTKVGLHQANLSEREREILIKLAWGYSNKEIANNLQLSVKTVETYRVRVGEKVGLRSRTEMVQYALRQGWLNESDSFVRLST